MEADTGQCYNRNADAILVMPARAVLVHGRPTMTKPPYCEMGHAWIEMDGYVFDFSFGEPRVIPRKIYYAVGKINPERCLVYNTTQAMLWMALTGHYGPWEGPDGVPPTPAQIASWDYVDFPQPGEPGPEPG